MLFLPKPWVGRLSDNFNRKKVWLLDVPLFFTGMTFLFFAENLIFLVPGIILFYLAEVVGEISFNMYISASSDKTKKGILFGLMFFSIFIGNIGGEFFVLLNIVKDIRVYFLIYMIFSVSSYFIIIFVISNPTSEQTQNSTINAEISDKKQSLWMDIFKTPIGFPMPGVNIWPWVGAIGLFWLLVNGLILRPTHRENRLNTSNGH